tara:strand:+ start:1582 stop:1770 length:189 start_codon:yes stop_codon:yes gene_type:complete
MSNQYMKASVSNAGVKKLEAGRKSAWMRENERIANPPRQIDWTATANAGKAIFIKEINKTSK